MTLDTIAIEKEPFKTLVRKNVRFKSIPLLREFCPQGQAQTLRDHPVELLSRKYSV